MKLHTENIGGNIHKAATFINKMGWAEYLISLYLNGGSYSTAVFRMPDEMVWKIREEDRRYASDSHHDDPK